MDKPYKYFDIDLPINDKRIVVGLKLNNGIKIVLISNPKIKISACSIGVGAGYLQDKFEGTAHFLEHLLFMGSSKFPEQNTYHSYVQTCGGIDNAFTGDDITCYFLELDTEFLEQGIEMLSWFFREPILDMKHINSEREIINSEHKKNILSDLWISDDIFKKFIIKSKYSNFGTGNSVSLRDITKSDIMDYYNTYYTTDNMYVAITDTLPIEKMKEKYLPYFISIPKKLYSQDKPRFELQELKLIDENLIVFKSISQYNFLNFYLIIKCNQSNQLEFQLVNLISQIIGLEYVESYSYCLKEQNIAKFVKTSIDYYYDYECVLNVSVILVDGISSSITKISLYFNELLNQMSLIDELLFEKLYDNFRKINFIQCLNDSSVESSELTNEVVANLIKGSEIYCVMRKYMVPEYKSYIYTQFINLLNTLEIKITTNINIDKINDNDKYLTSTHYKTKYYLSKFLQKNPTEKIVYNFNFKNIIPDFEIPIKTNLTTKFTNKQEFPKLVYKNDLRSVYLLNYNKYDKPIINISIIRKNSTLNIKTNSLICNIFIGICGKILNYYLEVMFNYKMSFSLNLSDDCIVYNFCGLDYLMNKFISRIVNKITYYSVKMNQNSKKYFYEVIRDMKENLTNLKYNSPYILCMDYMASLITNDFLPLEAIEFLNALTYEEFFLSLDKLLVFEHETYIIIGNLNISNFPIMNEESIKNALEYVDILSLNSLRYQEIILKIKPNIHKKINYLLNDREVNEQEVNNCILNFYLVKTYELEFINNNIKHSQLKEILKDKLIYELLTGLLNEPLFDKIRTVDKLGYIVKCMLKYNAHNSHSQMYICYLIQSEYNVEKINNSISSFNKLFYSDFKTNKDKFKKMFSTLKASKIAELKKKPSNLEEEVSLYLSCIINKYGTFNLKNASLEILEKIKFSVFSEYVDDFFTMNININKNSIIIVKK